MKTAMKSTLPLIMDARVGKAPFTPKKSRTKEKIAALPTVEYYPPTRGLRREEVDRGEEDEGYRAFPQGASAKARE
jgi:hypothetical protein